MSNYIVSFISRYTVLLADSIFIGIKMVVPVLFVLFMLNINKFKRGTQIGIKTSGRLLIFGGALFIYTITSNVLISWSSENEAERDMMIAFATGPHWFQFYFPLLNYAILPMTLWFKKGRNSPYTLISIVLVWYVTGFYSEWVLSNEKTNAGFTNQFDYNDYFFKMGLFFILFILFYIYEKWKFSKSQII